MLDGTFDVELTDDAEKHYNMLDANMTRRVSRAINLLAQNPLFGPNITKLRGEYAWAIQIPRRKLPDSL